MAHLHIRVELQRSSKGIELSKLERLSKEVQRLLRSLGEDVGIQPDGTWVAQRFYDQGIGFDATYQATDVDDLQAAHFVRTLDRVLTVDESGNWQVPGVSTRTLVQSARVAKLADDDEVVRLGLYYGSPSVEWRPLVKSRAQAIVEHFDNTFTYRGMLQGMIHSLYKEADPPYFDLRDLVSRELVKCYYEPEQYSDVHAALQRRSTVVLVAGWITARRSTRVVGALRLEKITPTHPINRADLEAFFGSAPGWTGDLTTADFVDSARRRETDGE